MKNIKTDPAIIARRGMDSISANILNETYRVYPRSLTVKILAKNLKIREKSVLSALRKISSYGVPIEIKINKNGEKEVKSSLKEPISWIEKEKASAEKMLSLLGELTPSSSESINNQRKINYRIYKEYVSNLNELFDKWASLKLID
jgi:DNA-binding Lrp family transcriptional regulator|tara:strand:+ start:52 stop:489 length:438 start_codon:yes stop_codon:yes gene_type:complete